MAKNTEIVNDDAKAKARHAKIAKEKVDAEKKAKQKIEDDKWKAKRAEERRREEIKKLPRDQRAAAKAELKEQIRHRKYARASVTASQKCMTRQLQRQFASSTADL